MAQTSQDPFNWPMPSRSDLMSLNTLTKDKDLFRIKTAGASTRIRATSQNLETADILGKLKITPLSFSSS